MKSILTKFVSAYFDINRYLPWHSWHNAGLYVLGLIIIIGVLIPVIVYRKNILKLMAEAESSSLPELSGAAADFIQRFQDSDMDDRMVYVIARLITKLPIVNLLVPTPVLAKVLNFFVQSTFDRVKGLLKARAANITTNNLDPNDVDSVIAHILGNIQHVVDDKYKNIVDPKAFMYEISKSINKDAAIKMTLTQDHPDLVDSAVHQVIDTDKVVKDVLSSLDGFDVDLTSVTEDDIKNVVNKIIK